MAAETTPVHHRRAREVRAPGQQRRARRRLRLSARRTGAVLGAAFAVALVPASSFASCAGPLVTIDDLPVLFEGRTDGWVPDPETGDRTYRWTVERPIRGVEAAEEVDVLMYVSHRVGEDMFTSSSIDVGHEPTLGDLYLVGAAGNREAEGAGLSASACGGILQAVADPAQEPDFVGPAVRPWRGHAVIAGAVPMVAALIALNSARRAG